jgi:hypothetical protein
MLRRTQRMMDPDHYLAEYRPQAEGTWARRSEPVFASRRSA